MSEKPDRVCKYVYFAHVQDKPKTSVWSCRMNKTKGELGLIKWYSAWRRYCYFPMVQAVYSSGCLADIENFIEWLMDSRRSENAKEEDDQCQ